MNKLKTVIQNLIAKVRSLHLSRQQKVVFSLIAVAVITLVGGSLYILYDAVIGANEQAESKKVKELDTFLESSIDDLNNNIDDYGKRDLFDEVREVQGSFDSYDKELEKDKETLNGFKMPISSPIENIQ